MHKLSYQPQNVREALVLAEAHLRAIGLPELSPIRFVQEAEFSSEGLVTASIFPLTKLRVQEIVPGLKLRSGNSIIDVTKVIPTNKEVVYKTNRGGLFRMPTEQFVKLAIQQGYKKIWNIKNFLVTLRTLLKPVLDTIPLMWVMKWVLNSIRGKKGGMADKLPIATDKIERGTRRT